MFTAFDVARSSFTALLIPFATSVIGMDTLRQQLLQIGLSRSHKKSRERSVRCSFGLGVVLITVGRRVRLSSGF